MVGVGVERGLYVSVVDRFSLTSLMLKPVPGNALRNSDMLEERSMK